MKKYIITCMISFMGFIQLNANEDCVIPLMLVVANDNVPGSASATLESRIRHIITENDMEGGAKFSIFSVVASITDGTKEVIQGTRPLITLTTDVQLFIGNNYTGDKFAAHSISLSGAGQSEAKAYTAAFRGIGNNREFKNFLNKAKEKINQYYNTQIPNIISQAKVYATQREFKEALCLLTSVPTCCNQYDEIEKCMLDIYQDYINHDCAEKIAKARSIWIAGQDEEAAIKAGPYLSAIDPSSACMAEALALAEEIYKQLGDKWNFYKELQRANVVLQKDRIAAIRDIGVAFGENQKAKTINEHWLLGVH